MTEPDRIPLDSEDWLRPRMGNVHEILTELLAIEDLKSACLIRMRKNHVSRWGAKRTRCHHSIQCRPSVRRLRFASNSSCDEHSPQVPQCRPREKRESNMLARRSRVTATHFACNSSCPFPSWRRTVLLRQRCEQSGRNACCRDSRHRGSRPQEGGSTQPVIAWSPFAKS